MNKQLTDNINNNHNRVWRVKYNNNNNCTEIY